MTPQLASESVQVCLFLVIETLLLIIFLHRYLHSTIKSMKRFPPTKSTAPPRILTIIRRQTTFTEATDKQRQRTTKVRRASVPRSRPPRMSKREKRKTTTTSVRRPQSALKLTRRETMCMTMVAIYWRLLSHELTSRVKIDLFLMNRFMTINRG